MRGERVYSDSYADTHTHAQRDGEVVYTVTYAQLLSLQLTKLPVADSKKTLRPLSGGILNVGSETAGLPESPPAIKGQVATRGDAIRYDYLRHERVERNYSSTVSESWSKSASSCRTDGERLHHTLTTVVSLHNKWVCPSNAHAQLYTRVVVLIIAHSAIPRVGQRLWVETSRRHGKTTFLNVYIFWQDVRQCVCS